MTIQIFIEPKKTYSWREFKREKEPYSISLDGFVSAPTKRELKGPYANYDHHTGTDRISTRSTSEQVYLEINLGLFKTFRKDGIPTVNIYVNDVDEDVCLAIWLFKNHERVAGHGEPSINRLVWCEDKLDCTGGAYPLGDVSIRRQMAWIFEPYQKARFEKRLESMNSQELVSIVESVCARITAYTLNNGEEIGLDGHFETVGGGPGWALVRETGTAARLAMYSSGVDAFGVVLNERESGVFDYVLGRRSVWIPFDLEGLFKVLNKSDKNITKNNRWGGSNTIGGSPRETGSSFSPKELEKIVNGFMFGA